MHPVLALKSDGDSGKRFLLGVLLSLGLVLLALFLLNNPETMFPDSRTLMSGQQLLTKPETFVQESESRKVRLDFVPPFYLDNEQLANIKMVQEIIRDPASWGLTDKAPIPMDHNTLQVFLSLLGYENQYRHYDSSGQVQPSYGDDPCCYGIAQVNYRTCGCRAESLKDIRENAWQGAKIFQEYYDTWAPKAGDRAYEVAVAVYKNAVVMNQDLTAMVLDENGLPIIPPDDPADPMDFASQVQSVFIDPSTGEPRFKFTFE